MEFPLKSLIVTETVGITCETRMEHTTNLFFALCNFGDSKKVKLPILSITGVAIAEKEVAPLNAHACLV